MENLEKLQLACQKYGKTELARRLGVTTMALYHALARNRPLKPVYMLQIDRLLADTVEPTQGTTQEQSTLSQLERLILDKVKGLTEQEQAQVLAYVVQLEALHDK